VERFSGQPRQPEGVCTSRSIRAIEQLPLRVDLTRSPRFERPTAIGALRPSRVDV
jgi:hypothetical protein